MLPPIHTHFSPSNEISFNQFTLGFYLKDLSMMIDSNNPQRVKYFNNSIIVFCLSYLRCLRSMLVRSFLSTPWSIDTISVIHPCLSILYPIEWWCFGFKLSSNLFILRINFLRKSAYGCLSMRTFFNVHLRRVLYLSYTRVQLYICLQRVLVMNWRLDSILFPSSTKGFIS